MMETVLDVGLNDGSVLGLRAGLRRRAVRLGLLPPADPDVRQDRARASTASEFDEALDAVKKARGADSRPRPRRGRSRRSSSVAYKERRAHADRPASSRRTRASSSTSRSTPCSSRGTATRARLYRRREHIPRRPGHRGQRRARWCSATWAPTRAPGVAFTRDPATGERGVYGDYLPNAQGEDVVAGIRNTMALAELERARPGVVRRQLIGDHGDAGAALPRPVRHRVHDRARASCGCCRPAWASGPRPRRSGSPCQLVDEGLIDLDEALRRVTGDQLAHLMFPRFDAARGATAARRRA